jgi:hypothetical protein
MTGPPRVDKAPEGRASALPGRPPVAAMAEGVMAARGLGVATVVGRGVTPEKSDGLRSGFSPAGGCKGVDKSWR